MGEPLLQRSSTQVLVSCSEEMTRNGEESHKNADDVHKRAEQIFRSPLPTVLIFWHLHDLRLRFFNCNVGLIDSTSTATDWDANGPDSACSADALEAAHIYCTASSILLNTCWGSRSPFDSSVRFAGDERREQVRLCRQP